LLTALAFVIAVRANPRLALLSALTTLFIALLCVTTGKFAARYVAFATPLLLAALAHTRSRTAALLSIVISLGWLGFTARAPEQANDDWRGAADFLRAQRQPDEMVLLISGHSAPILNYYWPQNDSQEWVALQQDPVLDVRHALDYDRVTPMLNHALAGKSGVWLLTWQDAVSDPSNITRTLLRRQSHLLQPDRDSRDFHGLRLQHYRFEQPWRTMPESLAALALRSTVRSAACAGWDVNRCTRRRPVWRNSKSPASGAGIRMPRCPSICRCRCDCWMPGKTCGRRSINSWPQTGCLPCGLTG
jgi:hypothetical protein